MKWDAVPVSFRNRLQRPAGLRYGIANVRLFWFIKFLIFSFLSSAFWRKMYPINQAMITTTTTMTTATFISHSSLKEPSNATKNKRLNHCLLNEIITCTDLNSHIFTVITQFNARYRSGSLIYFESWREGAYWREAPARDRTLILF